MAVRVVWRPISWVWKLKDFPVHTVKIEGCLIAHNIETSHRLSRRRTREGIRRKGVATEGVESIGQMGMLCLWKPRPTDEAIEQEKAGNGWKR